MKIRCYSDIHNEFRKHQTQLPRDLLPEDEGYESFMYQYVIPPRDDDHETVLILAGDIDSIKTDLHAYLMKMIRRFRFVFYVPGNHEYYMHTMKSVNSMLLDMNKTMSDCFHAFVDRASSKFVLDDVLFCGGTLWTDLKGGDMEVIREVKQGLNDFRYIHIKGIDSEEIYKLRQLAPHFEQYEKKYHDAMETRRLNIMTTDHMMRLHQLDKDNISRALKSSTERRKVVISHHIPCETHFSQGHACNMNNAFTHAYNCTDMDEVIRKADYWFCGHGHNVGVVKKHDCKIIANCVGYSQREHLEPFHGVWEI